MRTLIFLAFLCLTSPAMAWNAHGTASISAACPFHAYALSQGYDDGCGAAAAPVNPIAGLSYQNTNLLAAAGTSGSMFQNNQTTASNLHLTNNPAGSLVWWDVPGDDYAVGVQAGPLAGGKYCNGTTIPCSATQPALIDPETYNWATDPAGTGCRTDTTTYSGGVVTCHPGAATINMVGFDWAVSDKCIGLDIYDGSAGDTTAGTLYFTDNNIKWAGDATCVALRSKGSASGVFRVMPVLIDLLPAHVWTINIWRNNIDDNGENAYNTSGNPLWVGVNAQFIGLNIYSARPAALFTSGQTQDVRYNWFHDAMGRLYLPGLSCSYTLDYNVFHNLGWYGGNAHNEFIIPQSYVAGSDNYATCPGYNGPAVGSGGTTITSWASIGGAWGQMTKYEELNNAVWEDSNVVGVAMTAFFDDGWGGANPGLQNIQAGTWALNVYGLNQPWDGGSATPGNGAYYGKLPNLLITGTANANGDSINTSGGAGTGYGSGTVNDILGTGTGITACATGTTPYSRPPTFRVYSGPGVEVTDTGDCGYSSPGAQTAVHLVCVYCVGHTAGFDTGWTLTTGNSWLNAFSYAVEVFNAAGHNSGGNLNANFINFDSLSIKNNMIAQNPAGHSWFQTNPGSANGDQVSCATSPGIGTNVPTSATAAPWGLPLSGHNAVISGNIDQTGAAHNTLGSDLSFNTVNGC